MRRAIGRGTIIIAAGIAAYLGFYVEDVQDAKWVDETEQVFRALSLQEGGAEIEVVWHHSATRDDITAKELCRITNERFGLGCAYFLSIHPNGKVMILNDADEHTPSVGGRNSRVLSICFVGNYDENPVPEIMINRAEQIKKAFDKFDADNVDFKIKGYYFHSDFRATACPGKYTRIQLRQRGLVDGTQHQ